MKKLCKSLVILLSLAVLGLTGCALSKEEIFDLVLNNQELLLNDISNNNFDKSLELEEIESITGKTMINYYCGAIGFSTETSYYGFIYVEDDSVETISFKWGAKFEPQEDGYYWSDGTDNFFYIEKICDCFYYYEQHY